MVSHTASGPGWDGATPSCSLWWQSGLCGGQDRGGGGGGGEGQGTRMRGTHTFSHYTHTHTNTHTHTHTFSHTNGHAGLWVRSRVTASRNILFIDQSGKGKKLKEIDQVKYLCVIERKKVFCFQCVLLSSTIEGRSVRRKYWFPENWLQRGVAIQRTMSHWKVSIQQPINGVEILFPLLIAWLKLIMQCRLWQGGFCMFSK